MEARMAKKGFYVVEKILDMQEHSKGNPYLPSLLVQWEGYNIPTWVKLNTFLCPGATADWMVIDYIHENHPLLDVYIDKSNGKRRFSIASKAEVEAQFEKGEWLLVEDIDAEDLQEESTKKKTDDGAADNKSYPAKARVVDLDEIAEPLKKKRKTRSSKSDVHSPVVNPDSEIGAADVAQQKNDLENVGADSDEEWEDATNTLKLHKFMLFCGRQGFEVTQKVNNFRSVVALEDFNLENPTTVQVIRKCLEEQYGQTVRLRMQRDNNGELTGRVVKT